MSNDSTNSTTARRRRRKRRSYPHGTAIDPDQIKDDVAPGGGIEMSDLFVTMCFFARLGFVQPPSCLKCAYRSSRKKKKKEEEDAIGAGVGIIVDPETGSLSSCTELVPWRRDANVALHPDNGLEGNVVFLTCATAVSLVSGDAYPSIRWDARNRRLLHEI